jgi:hypothetical protein
VLPIAPSTYYAHKAAERDPELRSARLKRDEAMKGEIRRVWKANFEVYGVRKGVASAHARALPGQRKTDTARRAALRRAKDARVAYCPQFGTIGPRPPGKPQ